jgi:hypothetical protein
MKTSAAHDPRIDRMTFASVYPYYVSEEKKWLNS